MTGNVLIAVSYEKYDRSDLGEITAKLLKFY